MNLIGAAQIVLPNLYTTNIQPTTSCDSLLDPTTAMALIQQQQINSEKTKPTFLWSADVQQQYAATIAQQQNLLHDRSQASRAINNWY